MLYGLVLTIHFLVSLFLIGVVLLQSGKAGDMAGAFGGGGTQTVFGPRGTSNVLTRLTAWSAGIFMVTSFLLVLLSGGERSVLESKLPSAPLPAPASAPATTPGSGTAAPVAPPAASPSGSTDATPPVPAPSTPDPAPPPAGGN